MKTASIIALAGLATVASGQWYNGDPDLVNGLAAEFNTSVTDAYVFDDFNHGGGVVDVIYGNYFWASSITGYTYEIRSGMSNGFGGTLHASGNTDGAYSMVPNGFDNFGFLGYTLTADIPNVALGAGTYHMALSPIGNGTGRGFVQTTSGANSVGTPGGNNDNSFFYSVYFGSNYGRAGDQLGINPADFSYGVVVPAPASAALLGLGALVARRRR
jgi:hypothetical protein